MKQEGHSAQMRYAFNSLSRLHELVSSRLFEGVGEVVFVENGSARFQHRL